MSNVHNINQNQQSEPPAGPAHGGGRGGDGDIGERVAKLEEKVSHLATKSDVQEIKIWALKGVVIGMVAAASLAIAILKLFAG